jgi:hypothetical protein
VLRGSSGRDDHRQAALKIDLGASLACSETLKVSRTLGRDIAMVLSSGQGWS